MFKHTSSHIMHLGHFIPSVVPSRYISSCRAARPSVGSQPELSRSQVMSPVLFKDASAESSESPVPREGIQRSSHLLELA